MLIGLFGTGRNGSSLLGRLLDGLPDTYVHPVEEKFITAFDDLMRHGRVTRLVEQNCTTRPLTRVLAALPMETLGGYFCRSLDELLKHCAETIDLSCELRSLELDEIVGKLPQTFEEFTLAFLRGIASRVRPDVDFCHYLFKSIEVPYIAEYENRFSDMKFIHIVRDPVAVCSSQKRSLMENKGLPASYLGYDWLSCMIDKRWVPHARFISMRHDDPRHIVVRYEDLVVDPVGEVGRVAEGLGLALPPRPTVQTIFYDLDKTSWGDNPSKKGVETPTQVEAELQQKNRYDEILSSREIDLIALKTRELLPGLGYKNPSDATQRDVLRKYLVVDKWELMHYSNPRYLVRGLLGLVYRRAKLF